MVLINENDFLKKYSSIAYDNNYISKEYYDKYEVAQGLRYSNNTGVLVGLTDVGSVYGYDIEDGKKIPKPGQLFYRGINIKDIVHGFESEERSGFEEVIFLLIFGRLPTKSELTEFNNLLDECRYLPEGFTENMILKIPSKDIMNKLQRSVLVLYSHDYNPDDISINNLVRQSLQLISLFPTIISYGYQAKSHYFNKNSLFIHAPQKGIGTARNILHMIRSDNSYTKTEADALDLCLVIHAEHGGGNNSTFATHVVSSSGTDTYSTLATAIGALKGPKHGGANLKVFDMITNIKENVSDLKNMSELKSYLYKILKGETFNKEGLIYGMGHAVYTISDPRAELLKKMAYKLALEKNQLNEYLLYTSIEDLTKEIFKEIKGADFNICANVDLYSGFIYKLLNIPSDLYTPLFACARIAGWCAHRIEQVVSDKKIMRPAYVSLKKDTTYTPLSTRK